MPPTDWCCTCCSSGAQQVLAPEMAMSADSTWHMPALNVDQAPGSAALKERRASQGSHSFMEHPVYLHLSACVVQAGEPDD